VFQLTRPEEDGLVLVQQGVPNQIYTVPPAEEGGAAGTSFLATLPPREGRQLVLIGRTYLSANPYSRSLVNNLNSLAGVNGAGMLIADGMIVYHSQTAQMWTTYQGQRSDTPAFFDRNRLPRHPTTGLLSTGLRPPLGSCADHSRASHSTTGN